VLISFERNFNDKTQQKQTANFRSQLGSLQYDAKETRDDIAADVNMIAQKCKAPTVGAAKAVKRVMAYLNGTADRKLTVPCPQKN